MTAQIKTNPPSLSIPEPMLRQNDRNGVIDMGHEVIDIGHEVIDLGHGVIDIGHGVIDKGHGVFDNSPFGGDVASGGLFKKKKLCLLK